MTGLCQSSRAPIRPIGAKRSHPASCIAIACKRGCFLIQFPAAYAAALGAKPAEALAMSGRRRRVGALCRQDHGNPPRSSGRRPGGQAPCRGYIGGLWRARLRRAFIGRFDERPRGSAALQKRTFGGHCESPGPDPKGPKQSRRSAEASAENFRRRRIIEIAAGRATRYSLLGTPHVPTPYVPTDRPSVFSLRSSASFYSLQSTAHGLQSKVFPAINDYTRLQAPGNGNRL